MLHKSHIFLTLTASFFIGFSSFATEKTRMPNEILSEPFGIYTATAGESDDITDDESKFTLYINQGTLSIKYGKPVELINGEVIVYNLLGQEITRKKLENSNLNQISIPVQNTCYLVKISYSGKVHTQKVMISAD
jgi:hypothetical protein